MGVLAHEFTHYVHSLSTWHAVADVLFLIGFVHAGIQRLEEQPRPVTLPLTAWADESGCPAFVRDFVRCVRASNATRTWSYGKELRGISSARPEIGSIERAGGDVVIRVSATVGVPVKRLALMEGAAVTKKCNAVGTDDDLKAKRENKHWHYIAVYEACRAANTKVDPMGATKYLADISLCSEDCGGTFSKGLDELRRSESVADFKRRLVGLYKQECHAAMAVRLSQIETALAATPAGHKCDGQKSWAAVTLENAAAAVRRRQKSPLSLIEPDYLGVSLHELATEIGSPVVLTNDMRLSVLCDKPEATSGRNAVKTISRLCRWLISEGVGPFACPYAGCPGCPPLVAGEWCKRDARLVLAPCGGASRCFFHYSAMELRVAELVASTL